MADTVEGRKVAQSDIVDNVQQFFSWYEEVEARMAKDNEAEYYAHVDDLSRYSLRCEDMLKEIDHALNHLEVLHLQYKAVSTSTSALHEECEELMKEQTDLAHAADAIATTLANFTEVDRIFRRLHGQQNPTAREGFLGMLRRLDTCIEHISAHPEYKDANVYLARTDRCVSRTLR